MRNMGDGVFIIGNGQITRLEGQCGTTPDCPDAKFKRGDVVKVSRRQGCSHLPDELVVAVAIPPHFSPDFALADLVGEPRPLMHRVGARAISYVLVREGDPKPYHLNERDLRPSKKPPVELGTVALEAASQHPT